MVRTGFIAAVAATVVTAAAASESGPVFVVPGRADVPVVYFGRDISGAVVEGDWGLNRPGNIDPTVIYPTLYPRRAYDGPPPLSYFPSMGGEPRYGRREAPMDRRPRPAQSYHRSYTSQSDPTPATAPAPYNQAQPIIEPQININRDRYRDQDRRLR